MASDYRTVMEGGGIDFLLPGKSPGVGPGAGLFFEGKNLRVL